MAAESDLPVMERRWRISERAESVSCRSGEPSEPGAAPRDHDVVSLGRAERRPARVAGRQAETVSISRRSVAYTAAGHRWLVFGHHR